MPRADSTADQCTGERIEKQQPDETAEQHAGGEPAQRAHADQIDCLPQRDLAFGITRDDAGILDLDDVLLLQLHEFLEALLGCVPAVEGDADKLAHLCPPP